MHIFRYASLALVLAACSNNSGGNDGGTDATGGNTFSQTGQIVDFTSKAGVAGMIVSGGGNSATTDSKGNYTLAVPKSTPYTMVVAGDVDAGVNYLTLNEQEWSLGGNADRGQTSAVSNPTESLLKAVLVPPPNNSLAVLTIQVIATGACASATGATISVPGLPAPDAGATDGGASGPKMWYFDATSFPSATATSVTDGILPSAIIWDLQPTASFNTVTVTPPGTCKVKAFPTSDPSDAGPGPNLTYTGNVKLEPSAPAAGANVASFMRVFLE